jgi:hypothetical protein
MRFGNGKQKRKIRNREVCGISIRNNSEGEQNKICSDKNKTEEKKHKTTTTNAN